MRAQLRMRSSRLSIFFGHQRERDECACERESVRLCMRMCLCQLKNIFLGVRERERAHNYFLNPTKCYKCACARARVSFQFFFCHQRERETNVHASVKAFVHLCARMCLCQLKNIFFLVRERERAHNTF